MVSTRRRWFVRAAFALAALVLFVAVIFSPRILHTQIKCLRISILPHVDLVKIQLANPAGSSALTVMSCNGLGEWTEVDPVVELKPSNYGYRAGIYVKTDIGTEVIVSQRTFSGRWTSEKGRVVDDNSIRDLVFGEQSPCSFVPEERSTR